MERKIEICCGSYYDCLQAHQAGALRVELNSALHLGGLTPSLASLVLTKAHTKLEVITMARPRGAGFCYDDADFATMLIDTKAMLEHGADGVAFGCLNKNRTVNIEQTTQMVKLIHEYHKTAVFHRAFDCCANPVKSIESLIKLKVDRVLTSGQKPKATQAIALLKKLQDNYGSSIELLAGSGINASNAVALMEETGISQVHSSCKGWLNDRTTTSKNVSFSYGVDDHINDYECVSADLVGELIASIS